MVPALKLAGLKKIYRNRVEAVRGIDLEVAEGDFFALLGPNGAGKSTAIGIICSLVNRTSGTVEVFGHDIEKEWAAARACIGLVPQEFNFNVWEPVEEILINQAGYYGIPRREARARAEEALVELGLWDKRRAVARTLSGGMKRRLMIARSLVHRPRLLILDEPTAGVDIEIRRSMWRFMRETNRQGATIILTTHYLEEAENLCRRVAIIDNGVIIEHGDMATLLRKLHRETFVLSVDQALGMAPELEGYATRLVDTHTLEVDVENERDINGVFRGLDAMGIRVQTLRNKANRLEELFMGLVGK
ncbi:MAG: ABC transporter ATP-binding protein [Gammaproteobacteria bacterium]|nr:ABC transporter ATP-binding protein [Gammaproteobacteria bacterium]